MKKLLTSSLLVFLLCQAAFSQVAFIREPAYTAHPELITSPASSEISGKVQGEQGQGLPFARVLLLSAKDSTLIKGMVAGKTGEYQLEDVGAGHYLLLATRAGHQHVYSAPFTLAPGAGVMHIDLKPDRVYGASGTLTLMGGYGAHSKATASLQLTQRGKKRSWYGEYALLRDHTRHEFEIFRQVAYQQVITQTKDVVTRNPVMTYHTATAGMDYHVNSRTSFSGLLSGFSTRWEVNDAQVQTSIRHADQVANHVKMEHREVNHLYHLMGKLEIQHRLAANQEISFNLDRLYYHDHNPNQFLISNLSVSENTLQQDQFSIQRQTPIRIWAGKASYVQQFNTLTSLEAALSGSLAGLAHQVKKKNVQDGTLTEDTLSSYQVSRQEAILAADVNLHHQFTARTRLEAGLRWEASHTQADTAGQDGRVHRQKGTFLPQVLLSYALPKGRSLQLSYEHRLLRPAFNHLAPFSFLVDPFSGNIFLKPASKNDLGLSYRFKDNYLLALSYSHEKNPIIPWLLYVNAETNQQHARAENLRHNRAYSLTCSWPVRVKAWWQMQVQAMAAWQTSDLVYEGAPLQLSAGFGQISNTHTFTLPGSFSAALTGFYQTRSPFGIAYLEATGALSLAVEKKLKKEGGTLTFTADDLFGTRGFALSTNRPASHWNHSFKGRFAEPRILKLTYSRGFGNKQVKAIQGRASSSEEHRKRAGSGKE